MKKKERILPGKDLWYNHLIPMDTQEIRKLVEKYSVDQLNTCITQQIEKGENQCDIVDEHDVVIAELSKAGVIRELMDRGMKFSDALRELAKRIRAVYGKG